MDSYWQESNYLYWIVRLFYATDSKTATFIPLEELATDYQIEFLPREDPVFFVASSSKK
jgi:hypothetical protein